MEAGSINAPLLPPTEECVSPEDTASCCSKTYFCWDWGLLSKGERSWLGMHTCLLLKGFPGAGLHNGGLVDDDLPPGASVDDPRELHSAFRKIWQAEVTAADVGGRSPSLARALHTQFKRRFWFAGFLLFLSNICTLASPALLQQLLQFLQHKDGRDAAWQGYALGVGVALCAVGATSLSHQFWYQAIRVGVHSKAVLTCEVRICKLSGNGVVCL